MKNKLLVGLFFVVLAATLVARWFRPGYIYGGGDVGLPTYHPTKILEIIKYVWWEASAPGFPLAQGITSLPLYFSLALLEQLLPDPSVLQIVIFAGLLFLMGYGMYLVCDDYWQGKNPLFSVLAAVAYIFSPYLMVQVWHRFVHTSIYFAAALPFFFLSWKDWLENGRIRSLIFFGLLSLYWAVIFSTLGFIVSFWLFIGFHFLYEVFFPWKGRKKLLLTGQRFLVGFLIWIAVSLWWLLPTILTVPTVVSQQQSTSGSVSTLLALSNQSIIPNTVQGVNPFYLFQELDWGEIYTTPLFLTLPWLVVAIVWLGFIRAFLHQRAVFWGGLLIFALLISKGAAPPFGQAFLAGFSNFFWLGVLRNPFEKMGIMIPFSQAVLVSIGLNWLWHFPRRMWLKVVLSGLGAFMVLVNIFVWAWPFWHGKLFGNLKYSAQVAIPDFYRQADEWIKNQKVSGIILHLPLTVGEAISYSLATGGYQGAEPSQLLFSSAPSLSHGFNLKEVDQALKTIQIMFRHVEKIDPLALAQLLDVFGVRWVVLHQDVLTSSNDIDSPSKIEAKIGKLPFLSYQVEYGPLRIYRYDSVRADKIYLTKDFSGLSLGKNNQFWPWLIKPASQALVSAVDGNFPATNGGSIIVPQGEMNTPPGQIAYRENVFDELPPIRFLPTSKVYYLIRFKEWLETHLAQGREKLVRKINFSSKRLVEARSLLVSDHEKQFIQTLARYDLAIGDLAPRLASEFPFEKPVLEAIFARQILVLDMLGEKANSPIEAEVVSRTRKMLKKQLAQLDLYPYFDLVGNKISSYDRKIFRYEVTHPGQYYLTVGSLGQNLNLSVMFQIDDQEQRLNGYQKGNFNIYGPIWLDTGYHEISYQMPLVTMNLPEVRQWPQDEISLVSPPKYDPSYIEISLPDVPMSEFYRISFDYWVKRGEGMTVQVLQDTDTFLRGERVFDLDKFLGGNEYSKYWLPAAFSFRPRENSTTAVLRFKVDPWDNCQKIIAARTRKQKYKLCSDKDIRARYQRPTEAVVRNLQVLRLGEPQVLLVSSALINDSPVRESRLPVTYYQTSPVRYNGTFKLAEPAFLVFAQTIAPSWRLTLEGKDGSQTSSPQALVNLFANGWWIAKPGTYTFTLIYQPQNLVKYGAVTGGIVLISILIGYANTRRKNLS